MIKHQWWMQPVSSRTIQIVFYILMSATISSSLVGGRSRRALGQSSERFQALAHTHGRSVTIAMDKSPMIVANLSGTTIHRPLLQFGDEGPEVQSIQALLQLLGYYSGLINGRYQETTVAAVSAFQDAAGLTQDGIVGPTTWAKLLPPTTSVDDSRISTSNSTAIPAPSSQTSSSGTVVPSLADEGLSPHDAPDNHQESSGRDANAAPDSANPDSATPDSANPDTHSSAPSLPTTDVTLPTLRLGMRGPAVANLQERLNALGLLQGSIDGVFGAQTEASVKAAQRYFNLEPDGVVGSATWTALLQ